jgi:hypothetical protein
MIESTLVNASSSQLGLKKKVLLISYTLADFSISEVVVKVTSTCLGVLTHVSFVLTGGVPGLGEIAPTLDR